MKKKNSIAQTNTVGWRHFLFLSCFGQYCQDAHDVHDTREESNSPDIGNAANADITSLIPKKLRRQ
jgi:hypothetical protein